MKGPYTGAPGRGDLIRLLLAGKMLDQGAGILGFEPEKIKEELRKGDIHISGSVDTSFTPAEAKKETLALFYRVTGYKPKDLGEEETPEWFLNTPSFIRGKETSRPGPLPPPPPSLIPHAPWSRIWPKLKKILGRETASRRLDGKRAVKMIASGEIVKELPFEKRNTWAPAALVLIDRSRERGFFWNEETKLVEEIIRLRGKEGLTILQAGNGPGGEWTSFKEGGSLSPAQLLPGPETPVLLIGPPTGEWRSLGRGIKENTGLAPAALSSLAPEKVARPWKHIFWQKKHTPGEEERARVLEKILACLSVSLWTEPPLLRELCGTFTPFPVYYEQEVLNHPHIQAYPQGLMLQEEFFTFYRERFKTGIKQEERKKLLVLLIKHHAGSLFLLALEAGLYNYLTGEKMKIPGLSFETLMAQCARTSDDPLYPGKEAIGGWIKSLQALLPSEIWRESKEASTALLLAYREEIEKGEAVTLPPGVDPAGFPWIFKKKKFSQSYTIHQEGALLAFSPHNLLSEYSRLAPLYEIIVDNDLLIIDKEGGRELFNPGAGILETLPESLKIENFRHKLEITSLTRPSWASAIGRDTWGLWVEFEIEHKAERERKADEKQITTRLRWINPGEFMMGSPGDEPKRQKSELQHKVVLTRGFWLADTACTQELWEAVMGENPSGFKGARRPVERVSWEDVKKFMKKLNALIPGLELRLPWEAEWEYACRGGTTTPFSFGENITPEQVNYNGKYPYNDGKKGTYREETVAVKSLPPNPWGLYEMHGNVWEWCEDWFDEEYYTNSPVENPQGPESGKYRVARGGCWIFDGWWCRSAFRFRFVPGFRNSFLGFRFARGQ